MEKQIYCKKCHKEIAVGDKVCPNCGKKTNRKNGCLLACLIPLAIVLLFSIVGLFSDSTPTINTTDPEISADEDFKKSKDLSVIIGLTVDEAQEKTGLTFTIGTDSAGNENFLAENGNIVVCRNADTKKITDITIFGDEYKLFGVSNTVKSEKKKEILEANGFSSLTDSVYRYKDTYDGLEISPVIKYTANSLESQVFQLETEKAYTPALPTTVGAIYIGNGQMLEYSYDSIAKLAYDYENVTTLQQTALAASYNGTYVKIDGEVTQVDENGRIYVLCADEEATEEAGEILPMQAYGNACLVAEEMDMTWSINKGDHVIIYAKTNLDSYQNYMVTRTFECEEGILYSHNGKVLEAPVITSTAGGIQIPLAAAKSDSYAENVEASTDTLSVNSANEAIALVKAYYQRQELQNDPENWNDDYTDFVAEEHDLYYIVFATYGGNFEADFSVYQIDKNDRNSISQIQ